VIETVRADAAGTKFAPTQRMALLQPPVQPTMGEQEARALGPRPILLVVDDDEDVRSLIRDILYAGGYAVLEARDGADALAQLRDAAPLPVAILTDLSMPGVDGWQFIERVRKEARWFAIPIIVISSSMSPPTGVCFLCKPVGREALLHALTAIIGVVVSAA
jgi:CheY-like chemotaxis protein